MHAPSEFRPKRATLIMLRADTPWSRSSTCYKIMIYRLTGGEIIQGEQHDPSNKMLSCALCSSSNYEPLDHKQNIKVQPQAAAEAI